MGWLANFWSAQSTGAKFGLVLGLVLIASLIGGISYWTLIPSYRPLFSDLDQRDAAQIVGALDKMKVPYQLDSGGTRIMTPEDQVYRTRLHLMSEGVTVNNSVGYEIFDKEDFGMTEYAQRINYQRAIEGELVRTITSLDEVEHARIHVVMPQSGLFAKKGVEPKASVTLLLAPGASLVPAKVVGIQRLVAASVNELTPEQVTVLDQRGITLSQRPANPEDGEAGVDVRLEQKRSVETYFTNKALAVLEGVVGAGRAIVSVDVALNYDRIETRREQLLPLSNAKDDAQGAVSKKRETRNKGGSGAPNEDGKNVSSSSHDTSTTETDYEWGREVEHVVSNPGSIARISVGVLLPDGLKSAEIAKLKDTVSAVLGLQQKRGDTISLDEVARIATQSDAAAAPAVVAAAENAPMPPAPRVSGAPHDWRSAIGAVIETPIGGIVIAGLFVLLIVCGGLLGILFARGSSSSRSLPSAERDRVLAELREWLSQPVEADRKV